MNVRPLSVALQKTAIKELNEKPNQIQKDIEYIKEWLKKQPHLNINIDDQWVLHFLRGSKFSLEKTKEKIDKFYTYRGSVPDFFRNRETFLPPNQKLFYKRTMYLPGSEDWNGPSVILFKIKNFNPDIEKPEDTLKGAFMMLDVLINKSDNIIINGLIALVDCQDVTISQLAALPPLMIYKSTVIFQESYPIRLKAIHYLNMPSHMTTFVNLLKSFFNEKLKKRIHVHSDDKALYEHIPLTMLPNEYGGTGGTLSELSDIGQKLFVNNKDWFFDQDKYYADEKLRPKNDNYTDLQQMNGSFRKLEFD